MRTEAQKRADKKYTAEKMDFIGVKLPKSESTTFSDFANANSLPLATTVRAAVGYCITHNVKLSKNDILRDITDTDVQLDKTS